MNGGHYRLVKINFVSLKDTAFISSKSRCRRLLYNYKKANLSLLSDTLSHVPWNIIETTNDVEESWQLFKDLFFLLLIHVFLIYNGVGKS